jgi:hypothetical protein
MRCSLVAEPHALDDMPQQHKPLTQLMSDVMQLVVSDLQAAGVKPDEQLLMGMARVAGIMGDPDKVQRTRQDSAGGGDVCVGFEIISILRCQR